MVLQRLKALRLKHHKRQAEIAQYLGIKPREYSAYERGLTEQDAAHIYMLAQLYGVSLSYILGPGDDEPVSEMHGKADKN